MLNWLFDERAITENVLSEVHAALKFINPDLFADLYPAELPSAFGQRLGKIFQAQINRAEALEQDNDFLKWRLSFVELCLDTANKTIKITESPLRQKILSLESQIQCLESDLRAANSEKEQLEQQLSSLTVLNASLEAQVADLNRLVAKQHRRLAELIGAEPELP